MVKEALAATEGIETRAANNAFSRAQLASVFLLWVLAVLPSSGWEHEPYPIECVSPNCLSRKRQTLWESGESTVLTADARHKINRGALRALNPFVAFPRSRTGLRELLKTLKACDVYSVQGKGR